MKNPLMQILLQKLYMDEVFHQVSHKKWLFNLFKPSAYFHNFINSSFCSRLSPQSHLFIGFYFLAQNQKKVFIFGMWKSNIPVTFFQVSSLLELNNIMIYHVFILILSLFSTE